MLIKKIKKNNCYLCARNPNKPPTRVEVERAKRSFFNNDSFMAELSYEKLQIAVDELSLSDVEYVKLMSECKAVTNSVSG